MNSKRLFPSVALLLAFPVLGEAQGCLTAAPRSGKQSTHISTRTNDDGDDRRFTIRLQRGDCEIRVDARGEFMVRPDLTGLTSVSDGGFVEIEERDDDRDRKVRVTGGPARTLVYRWSVEGREGFDMNREQWFAEMLAAIERRTAMFAKTRVPDLVRQGGPDAVLKETERMDSDHARRVYFTTLLASARLNEQSLERLLRQAAEMTSDFERAELLRAVAKNGPMTDRITRASIAMAQQMSSDFEKRRALSAALESAISLESRSALFSAASTMSSSFELAELLIAAQSRSLVDSASGAAYFRAIERVSSDFERRRTLSALVKQRPESPNVLAGVLRSSASISSDFELASLLVEFARVVQVRGDLRELYLRAARSISSDHEYRRALQALLEQDRHI